MRFIFYIVIFVCGFIAGYFVSDKIENLFKKNTNEVQEFIVNQIKKVSKLITVEGNFSELYNYKDYLGYDWSFFRKKAIIKVKGKISMGINLKELKYTIDEKKKIIYIQNIPPPEILSIDHDISYYDITEGTFNSFDQNDYNKMNAKVKEDLKNIALKSELPNQARIEGNQIIEMLQILAQKSGYSIQIDTASNNNLKG